MSRSGKKQRALFGAALGAGATLALVIGLGVFAGAGMAASAVAPSNQTPPTISGTAQVGELLKTDNGTWSGTTPLTYTYQWRICNENGGACHDITGATGNEYTVRSADPGNTLRIQVTAKNSDGSDTSTSVPTAVIKASSPATTTTATTTTTAPPASNGCAKSGGTIPVADVSPPARLTIDQTQVNPSTLTFGTRSLTARFHVSACGGSVEGALVYVTAVPYGQFGIPNEQASGSDGWATLQFTALAGYPVSNKQQLVVMFVRARKQGDSILGGISTRRLVSFSVTRG